MIEASVFTRWDRGSLVEMRPHVASRSARVIEVTEDVDTGTRYVLLAEAYDQRAPIVMDDDSVDAFLG